WERVTCVLASAPRAQRFAITSLAKWTRSASTTDLSRKPRFLISTTRALRANPLFVRRRRLTWLLGGKDKTTGPTCSVLTPPVFKEASALRGACQNRPLDSTARRKCAWQLRRLSMWDKARMGSPSRRG